MSKVDLTKLRKGGADSDEIAIVRTGSPEEELFRGMGYKPVAGGKSSSKPAPKRAKRKTTAKKRVSKKST